MKKYLPFLALALILLPDLAFATSDASRQMQVMQDLLDKFAQNGKTWVSATQNAATSVFGVLALVEIALKMRKVVLSGGEEGPIRIVGILMTSLMTWGFFMWAMTNPEFVLGNIVHGFEKLGGQASGMGTLNPSQMIGVGIDLAIQVNNGVSTWTAVTNPAVGLTASITELCVIAGFSILGLQMFASLLHYYLLLACAPILLAGGALSFTRDWAIKQFQGAVTTGVKIFVIYLIAGVVTSFIPDFKSALENSGLDNMAPVLGMLAAAILILFLGFFAPSIASAIMGGTNSMSANEMAGFGASVGGAVALGAGLGLGGAQMAGSMLGKGAQGLGALGNMSDSLGSALGHMSSGGGAMKEALATGSNVGGQAASQASRSVEAAKRVGGDLPSGMTPSSAESRSLMGESAGSATRGGDAAAFRADPASPGGDDQAKPSTQAGSLGASGSGASSGGQQTSNGNVGGGAAQPTSAGNSGVVGRAAATARPSADARGADAEASRKAGNQGGSAGGASGRSVPGQADGVGASGARVASAVASPDRGDRNGAGANESGTPSAVPDAANSPPVGAPVSAGGVPGAGSEPSSSPTATAEGAGPSAGSSGAVDNAPLEHSAERGERSATNGHDPAATSTSTAGSEGPDSEARQGQSRQPLGDGSRAEISGPAQDSTESKAPGKLQRTKDLLDKTHDNFRNVKGFIPDAHGNASMHINVQE